MEENLTRFLQEIGANHEIKQCLDEFVRNIDEKGTEFASSALVLPLKYEYSMFTEEFQQLLKFLIFNPLYYEHLLRNIILKAVNEELKEMSRPYKVEFEQIHFVYRFVNLPLMDKYKFYTTIRKTLSNFTCIVVGRGEIKMYTRQTVWHCETKCTPNVVTNAAPICESCQKTMKECVPLRGTSFHVKLIAAPVEMVQTPKRVGTIYRKFDVILSWNFILKCLRFIDHSYIVDDLANFKVVYGSAYVITGIYEGIKNIFQAWNIVELEDV